MPEAVEAALIPHPEISWLQAEALGLHPAIVEQSARRFAEIMRDCTPKEKQNTAVVFVGRGSLDAEATADMHKFAALVAEATGMGRYEVCFYAMASPGLPETLERFAQEKFQRVVVLPHLLFGGFISNAIRDCVAASAKQSPQTKWLIADRLGPGDHLTAAIVDRVQSAWRRAEKCLSTAEA